MRVGLVISRIYLDNNSTTPILPDVVESIMVCLREGYLNPASQHGSGRRARLVLETAREQIAGILGASSKAPHGDHVIITSGGTEANNLAIRGLVDKPGEVLISSIEHPSALAAADELLCRGFQLKQIPVLSSGHVDLEALRSMISAQTQLVCVMLGNNEVGTLQPVAEIAELCRERGIPLHCDGVQVVGKLSFDFGKLGATSCAFSAHKFHGPKGVGGLLLRSHTRLKGLIVGGSQQLGFRPGTESIAAVVGMAKALECFQAESDARRAGMEQRRNQLEQRLQAGTRCVISGAEPRLPHTTNVSFPGVDRQALAMALDLAGVECSTGSACTSGSSEPSHVLVAMGCPREVVESSIRLSLNFRTTREEVDLAADRILTVVNDLRSTDSG